MRRPHLALGNALVDSVLRLKPAKRMRLLDVICGSLERLDKAIDEVWYNEAEKRLAAHLGAFWGAKAHDNY